MKWPTLIFLSVLNIQLACGINVGGMLDFSEPKPKIIERVYISQKEKTAIDKNKDNENKSKIGVICSSGGCNTTNGVESEGSDTDKISADVVVAVKTNLNNANDSNDKKAKEKNNEEEEVPDVPVVIGYGGVSDLPRSHVIRPDNPNYNQLNPHRLVVSDIERRFPELGTSHVRGGNNGFLPSIGVNIKFSTKPSGNGNVNLNGNPNYNQYPNYNKYYPQAQWKPGFLTPELTFFGKTVPVPWYRRDYDPYRTTQKPCICHPNSVWTPHTTPSYINLNHPGKQINNKLAPLN